MELMNCKKCGCKNINAYLVREWSRQGYYTGCPFCGEDMEKQLADDDAKLIVKKEAAK